MSRDSKQENLSELMNLEDLNKWEVGSEEIDRQFKENLKQSMKKVSVHYMLIS